MALVIPPLPQLADDSIIEEIEAAVFTDPNIIEPVSLFDLCPTRLFVVRGYFRNTLGEPGVNDFGVWDDAAFVWRRWKGQNTILRANCNADPARAGWNAAISKYFAQLRPGVWPARQGPHKGKPNHIRQMTEREALLARLGRHYRDRRELGEYQVLRVERVNGANGVGTVEWGTQNINCHAGTKNGTSSWGCITFPPAQWLSLQPELYRLMNEGGQRWDAALKKYGTLPIIVTEKKLA